MKDDDDLLLEARLTAKITAMIEDARQCPLGLYRLCCSDDEGDEVIIKGFHEEWDKMFMDYQYTLIEAARGTSKTSFAIFCVLWAIGANPNIRIKWLGPNDENAKKRKRVIAEYIRESEMYQKVFPGIKLDKDEPNNAFMLTVVRDARTPEPTLEAKGILSTGVGDRCELLICDDVVDMKNALLNPAMRPQVINKFLGDWLPTLNPKTGKILCIFTPYHEEDLNSYLKKRTQVNKRNRAITKDGKRPKVGPPRPNRWVYKKFAHGKPGDPYFSIFPELFSRERLREIHLDEGDLHYSRSRLCQALTKDTVAIMPEQLVSYDRSILTNDKLRRAIVVLSFDPSSGRRLHKGKLDYVGVGVLMFVPRCALDPAGSPPYEVFIPEAYQIKLPTRLQVKLIIGLDSQWGSEDILIESQGMQNLHEWLWEFTAIDPEKVFPINVGNTPKGQRLMAISPFFQVPEGTPPRVYFHPRVIDTHPQPFIVHLPDGTGQEALRTLRHQILSFPTENDDVLDVLTQGLQFIKTHLVPKYVDQEPRDGQQIEAVEVIIGKSSKQQDPFMEGRQAAMNGLGRDDNPYPFETDEQLMWYDGWEYYWAA
jgi:hypothetical protein